MRRIEMFSPHHPQFRKGIGVRVWGNFVMCCVELFEVAGQFGLKCCISLLVKRKCETYFIIVEESEEDVFEF